MTFARVRALIVVAVLFVTASVFVIMAISRDSQTATARHTSCPAGLVPVKTKMPEQRSQVTLNVLNGTGTTGLAQRIGAEFAFRGFKIKKTGNAKPIDKVAEIAFGPDAVGAAYLVSANFLVNGAEMDFDLKRKGPEVDVTLGTQFAELATSSEVNQTIALIGNPPPPPGTCEL